MALDRGNAPGVQHPFDVARFHASLAGDGDDAAAGAQRGGQFLRGHFRPRQETLELAGEAEDLWPGEAPLPGADDLRALLGGDAPAARSVAARLAAGLAEHQALVRGERAAVSRLLAERVGACAMVPRLPADVHDLAGLARLAERL